MLTSEQVLTHYDPASPVTLAGDASQTSIGAVLSPVMPDGSYRSVAFSMFVWSASLIFRAH